jgi:hypothetical protein
VKRAEVDQEVLALDLIILKCCAERYILACEEYMNGPGGDDPTTLELGRASLELVEEGERFRAKHIRVGAV